MSEYRQMTYKIGNCEFKDSFYENIENVLDIELYIDSVSELNFTVSEIQEGSNFKIWLNNVVYSKEINSIDYNYLSIQHYKEKPTVILSLFKYFSDSYQYWDLKWDLKKFFVLVKTNLSQFKDLELVSDDTSEDSIDYNIAVLGNYDLPIGEQYLKGIEILDDLYKIVKLEIGGLNWKDIYLTDEKTFSLDVIEPLLRKMKFDSVRYNHGIKEYGKDFICSYFDNFNIKRYIGIQVKAGNISGKVNSRIDEIFGQIDDTFSMPFREIGDKTDRFISTFFIIISGQFTDNAKDKILEKLPKKLIGNITFIDKDCLIDLIENIVTNQ